MADEKNIRELKIKLDLLKQENEYSKDIAMNLNQYFNTQKNISKLNEQINIQQKLWVSLNEQANKQQEKLKGLKGKELKTQTKKLENLEKELDTVSYLIRYDNTRLSSLSKQVTLGKLIGAGLNSMWLVTKELSGLDIEKELSVKYILSHLIEQQKAVKQTNLQLAISGQKSKILQESVANTTFEVRNLGKGLKDITEMITSYADESGRARLMTQQSQKFIAELAAGTSLGNVEAGRLAAKFSEIGVNAMGANKEIENVLNTSERMALNADKILKSISNNFSALSKFHFKRGIKELSELVVFSTKFKMDVSDTLSSMEKGRYLGSVVELSAQLRLAGGAASAVADPFKLLFAARNSPKQFAEMIKEMTKDISILNKEGEFEILSTGFDRLKIISEATSIPIEKLAEQARRTAQINIMQKSIPGFARTNKEYKNLIEGQAEWNKDLKIFEIVDPFNPKRAIDIRKISKTELDSFKSAGVSIEQRAKDTQDFQAVWINLTNTIKSAFLPLLSGLNKVTNWIQKVTEGVSGLGKGFIMFGTVAMGAFTMFGGTILSSLISLGKMNLQMSIMGKNMGKFSAMSKGMPKGGIIGNLFGGIGFGGIVKGAAILSIAAGGLSLVGLALQQFEGISWETLGIAGTAILGLTSAIYGLGLTFTATGGIGALIFGAGVAGLAAMGASLWVVGGAMKTLSEANIPNIGKGFDTIKTSVNAIDSSKLKEIRQTAESLRNMAIAASAFGGLGELFGSRPLQVEFKDKNVALNIDFTAEMDSTVVGKKTASTVAEVQFERVYYNK